MEGKWKLQLNSDQSAHLLSLPENGMGYQLVDIRVNSIGWITKVIAINSEFIYLDNKYVLKAEDIQEIRVSD